MRRARGGIMTAVAVGCAAMLSITSTATAQVTPDVERATARARALLDGGDGTAARALLDSLVGTTAAGSNDFAEALYWRGVLAERINEAERDWKRLVLDAPLAPRVPDALMRLGELDMLRGHPAEARVSFMRLLRDFPSGTHRAKGLLWLTRSYFEERNLPAGCSTLDSLRGLELPDGELRLQSNDLQRRCAGVIAAAPPAATGKSSPSSPVVSPAVVPPAEKSTAKPAPERTTGAGRYSVQLAAYDTRAEAADAVRRFAKRDLDARIDGDEKPFRVRVGYYATRADATTELKRLKKLGMGGFVAERAP